MKRRRGWRYLKFRGATSRRGAPWTKAEDRDLRRFLLDRAWHQWTIFAAADRHERTYLAIVQRARTLGIAVGVFAPARRRR